MSLSSESFVAGLTTSRIEKRKPPVTTQIRPEDLIMKLPGELRNRIYDLALLASDAVKVHCGKTRQTRSGPALVKRWLEPGILLASKQIRYEALPTYYLCNNFELALTTSEFDQACDWIKHAARNCGSRPFKTFRFFMTKVIWEDIEGFLSLARLFHGTMIELACPEYDESKLRPWNCYQRLQSQESIFRMPAENAFTQDALEEVVALGRQARAEDWHEQMLDVEFGLWADEKRRSSHYRQMKKLREGKAWRAAGDRASRRVLELDSIQARQS